MAFSPEVDIRRNILDVTRSLLIKHGITHLSIRMISREVGCSVGTIYFHFENKDVLIHSLIEEGFNKLIERQSDIIESESDLLKQIRLLCHEYIGFALDNPEYYEIMFMLKPERMARYPAQKYRNARRSIEIFSDILQKAYDQKLITLKNPAIHTNIIWSCLHGIVSLLLAKRIDIRIDQNQLIEAAINQVINPLAKNGSL